MEVGTIALIGAGTMGRRIALAALAAGYRTILEDVLPDRLAAAEAEILGWLAAGSKAQAMSQFSTAASVALACREADLVLDTLPEDAEMKIDVFCILEKFARPRAVLATNSTSLSITEIAAVTTRGEHCVGLRFFTGTPKEQLLEIVRGRETSDETVAACIEVAARMGKEAVVLDEPPKESS